MEQVGWLVGPVETHADRRLAAVCLKQLFISPPRSPQNDFIGYLLATYATAAEVLAAFDSGSLQVSWVNPNHVNSSGTPKA